jgi:membrane protein
MPARKKPSLILEHGLKHAKSLAHHVVEGGRVLYRAGLNFRNDGCANYCAAISFYALLSFFPILLLVVSILGYVFGREGIGIQDIQERLRLMFPNVLPSISQTISQVHGGRVTVTLVSIVVLFYVSMRVFMSFEFSINDIFKTVQVRSILMAKLKAVVMTGVFCTMMGAMFITNNLLAIIRVLEYETLQKFVAFFSRSFMTNYVVPFLVEVAIFHIIFHRIPHVRIARKQSLCAALCTALAFEALKHLFGLYIANLKSVDVLYGPFTALVFFLLYIYFSTAIIFYGAEVLAIISGNRK